MFVVVEFSYEYSYIHDTSEQSVVNIYGPFSTLEEAEEFRTRQNSPEDFEPYSVSPPEEAN